MGTKLDGFLPRFARFRPPTSIFGSFLGRPTCHCADGKRLHPQYQISVLGKPQAFNIPAKWVDKVREKIEMRQRFEATAATICSVNLKRFLKEKLHEKKKKLQEKEDRQI